MFKSWKYGNQNEPAEDFDGGYYEMYYSTSTTSNETNSSNASNSGDDLYTDGYDMIDVSDVHVVSEKELETVSEVVEEETPEPLYKVTFSPESYVDSKDIVAAFMRGRVIVLDIAELPREDFLRMFDYVMGAIQALGGEMQRISKKKVVILPADFDGETDIDDIEEEPYEEYEDYGEYDEEEYDEDEE